MLKQIKSKIGAIILTCGAWMTVTSSYLPVFAETKGGVKEVTAPELSTKIVNTLNDVLMPIGGVVIFVTVIIAAFKIISTANKPQERAEAMTSLPYIALGGLLLGGALLASGLIYGLMTKLHEAGTTSSIMKLLSIC